MSKGGLIMESWAVGKAKELHRQHPGLSRPPVDVEKLAEDEGLEWMHWPFKGSVVEAKQGRYIGIAEQVEGAQQRYLIAHALGHHLMHAGNQLSFYHQQFGILGREECEADTCAAHILIPEEELEKLGYLEVWEIAEHFDVPEELARQRVTDFATERELARWESQRDDYIP
jgi:Zn-dependent peptidase ImmA (M78 family)